MQTLAESSSSKSICAVEEIYNAMSWVHAMANCDFPTEFQFVRPVVQGLQKNLAKLVTKKFPVTMEMLSATVWRKCLTGKYFEEFDKSKLYRQNFPYQYSAFE